MWLWGSPPASLAQVQGCRSHWWSPDSEGTEEARCQVAAERCSGLSPLQREVEGQRGQKSGVVLEVCRYRDRRPREEEEKRTRKTQKHMKQEQLNMRQERVKPLVEPTVFGSQLLLRHKLSCQPVLRLETGNLLGTKSISCLKNYLEFVLNALSLLKTLLSNYTRKTWGYWVTVNLMITFREHQKVWPEGI